MNTPLPPEEGQQAAPKSTKLGRMENRMSESGLFKFLVRGIAASSHILESPEEVESIHGRRRSDAPNLRAGKLGIRIIAVTLVILILVGTLVPIESAAIAHGKVAVLSHRRTVQHLEGGIISQLLVKEGDKVTAGQTLITLDDTQIKAQHTMLQTQLWTAQAAYARLVAERENAAKLIFPEDLIMTAENNPSLREILANEKALFDNRHNTFESQRQVYALKADQIHEQIEGIEVELHAEERKNVLVTEEVDEVDKLLRAGLAQKSRLLALKRAKEESDGLIGKLRSNIAESKQRVLQAQGELLSFDEDRMKKNSEDLRDNQEIMVRKAEEFRAKGDVLARVAIKAPVSGVITGLKYYTVDGVIAPGTPIMDIVPQDDTLVIEAQLSPSDIDVVHQDLTARVMLTAYKSRTTPLLMGKVTMISPDIITDQGQQGLSSYYRMQVTVDVDDLKALKNITLYPGMPADVHVLTGSRSFFSYMLQPITDSMHNAFREQ